MKAITKRIGRSPADKHFRDALKNLNGAISAAAEIPADIAKAKAAFTVAAAGGLTDEDLMNFNGKLPEGMDGSESV